MGSVLAHSVQDRPWQAQIQIPCSRSSSFRFREVQQGADQFCHRQRATASASGRKDEFLAELQAIRPPAAIPWMIIGDFNLIYTKQVTKGT